MQYTKTDNQYIIKIGKGEEVLSSLTDFCVREGIENALIKGIGAVEWVSCGYYALDTKTYHFTQYDQLVEVASMTGNVMLKEGKQFLHVHAVFTDTSNTAFGGHVEEMRVGVVLEVVLTPLTSRIERKLDEHIGLFLMDFGS